MPSVKLSPLFNDQAITSSGAPASGYKVYSYVAGSVNTALATYTDSTGNTPQTNPVVLNANGFPTNGQIWLQSGLAYKLVFTDANDVVIKTEDNITGINDTGNAANQFGASGVTPTYVSASSFTLPGDQTTEFHVGRRVQFTVAAGTVYGSITSSTFTTLTTVIVSMDSGQALDAGLSAVNLSILRADKSAIPATIFSGLPLGGYRNKLIGGYFATNPFQRGSTFSLSAGVGVTVVSFVADRWQLEVSGADVGTQRISITPQLVNGIWCDTALQIAFTSKTASPRIVLKQYIESVRTFSAQSAILQLAAQSTLPFSITPSVKQFFGSGGTPSAMVTTTFPNAINVTASLQALSSAVLVPSIAGKNLGSSNNDYLSLELDLTAMPAAQNITIPIIEFVPGTTLSNFEARHVQQELALCQRYTLVFNNTTGTGRNIGWGQVFSATLADAISIPLPVTPRATPALTPSGTFQLYASAALQTAGAISNVGVVGNILNFAVAGAGMTPGALVGLVAANGASLLVSAEL